MTECIEFDTRQPGSAALGISGEASAALAAGLRCACVRDDDDGVIPEVDARDELFKAFGRSFFRQDLDAMYDVVTEDFTYSILVGDESRVMNTRQQVGAFFEERNGTRRDVRFEDVVFHHAPEATFMTYRITGTEVATGESFESVGVERYTFRDGRIAEKDVYSRPVG